MIVTKGTLDWAYPPFILATTAAAMGLEVSMFFTFYGLALLKKKLDLERLGARQSGDEDADDGHAYRHAQSCRRHSGRRCCGDGNDGKSDQAKRRRLDRRAAERRSKPKCEMIACQMTMDLFEYKLEDMIEGPVLGGAATYIETATKSDINLFI